MILNATTKKIQILLGAAVATNQCPIVVDYVDFTSTTTTPGNQLSNTNSTTAVDIVNAPAASTQRKVNLITVCNKDTEFLSVTIRLNDNGTMYNYVASMSLPINSTLQFTDTDGWSVIDAAGNSLIATAYAVDIQSYSSSGTWTKPTAATYVQFDVVGGGGGGGSGAAGGGGGGGKHMQFLSLASSLSRTVSVTVGSGGTAGNDGGNSSFGTYLYGYGGGAGLSNGSAGGGGGGTSKGGSSYGGYAVLTTSGNTAYADDRGAGGGAGAGAGGAGKPSYLGGGGGGVGAGVGGAGGSSFFSGGGGGGGGSVGGAGGASGGAATTASGGGAASSIAGAAGSSIKCGGGGGGGSTASGINGGAGGAAGGGGGGGGGSSPAVGGAGGRGQVWVISW